MTGVYRVYYSGGYPKCKQYIFPGFGILPGRKCPFCGYLFTENDST